MWLEVRVFYKAAVKIFAGAAAFFPPIYLEYKKNLLQLQPKSRFLTLTSAETLLSWKGTIFTGSRN